MRYFAKSLIISLATSNIAYATPALSNTLNYKAPKKSTVRKIVENFQFNYFAQYTGRSLGNNYADGATYNRFSGGYSENGERKDATGSQEFFQAFTLGYKLPKNLILSYGVTMQDALTDDVEYRGTDGNTYTRSNGRSYNNHRVSLWIPGVFSNKSVSLSTSVFYERPTTDFSKDTGMEYGYGIQPTLVIYSKVPGLYHGLTASYERFVYPDYEFYEYYTGNVNPDGTPWLNPDGSPMAPTQVRYNNPTKRRGMMGNIGGYMNYVLTDSLTFKSSVQFDYDQEGNAVGSLTEFGNNLDNVGNIGLGYSMAKGVNLQGGVTFSLDEMSTDNSALFGTLSLSI
jgi:hypothetical protein